MKLLLCTATAPESDLLRESLDCGEGRWASCKGHEIYLLHGGIGMVNMALSLGGLLAKESFDRAIMTGIAGAYERDLDLGEVVGIQTEIFADLGADAPEGFWDLERMGFPAFSIGEKKYYNRIDSPYPAMEGYRACVSASVNKVNGEQSRIQVFRELWPEAEVENMEGAAFFQACLQAGIPFWELRGISNYVEDRNPAAWDIGKAKQNAQLAVLSLLEEI